MYWTVKARRSRISLTVLAAFAIGIPLSRVSAQEQSDASLHPWRVQPSVGVWLNEDLGIESVRRVGQSLTVQMSHEHGDRGRLTASLGYYRLDDARRRSTFIQGQPTTEYFDSEIVPVSVGFTYDAWKHRSLVVSVGLEGGAALGREKLSRASGPPPIDRDAAGWSPVPLLSPSVALRHSVGQRVELSATGRLLLGFGDLVPRSVPAFGIGAVFHP